MTSLALDATVDNPSWHSLLARRWQVSLRLGRRDVSRHKPRTMLVVLLIAVATAVLGFAAVELARTLTPMASVRLSTSQDQDGALTTIDPATLMILGTVGVLTMVQSVLLIAPAFLIGMRRQVRDLGLLTASGAQPSDLRRAVVTPALVCGAVGSTVGAAIGFLAGMNIPAVHTSAEVTSGMSAALLVAVLGTMIAGGSAAYPAALAARVNPVDALAGRLGRPHARAARSGSRAVVVGCSGTAAVVVGGEIAVAGARSQTPGHLISGVLVAEIGLLALVALTIGALERMPTRRAVTAFVLRDAARHRLRVLPAVAASLAMVAGVVAATAFQATEHRVESARYDYTAPLGSAYISGPTTDLDALRNAAERLGPVRSVALVQAASPDTSQPTPWTIAGRSGLGERGSALIASGPLVANSALVDALGLGPRATDALASGFVLVANESDLAADNTVSIGVATRTIHVPGVVVPALHRYADVMITADVAEELGAPVQTIGAILTPEGAYSRDDEAALQAAIASSYVMVESGPPNLRDPGTAYALISAGILTVLLITSITAALATQESLPDLATLEAIGAAPRTRRRIAAGQAGLIATAGAWCGVPAGLALGALFVHVQGGQPNGLGASVGPFAVPWGPVLTLLLVLPLAVALLGALTARTSSTLVRRADR